MKLSHKKLWLYGAIAAVVVILIVLVAAPASNQLKSGSTYSRAPDGYGAWYAFMSERGTPVGRWQKPLADLGKLERVNSPITLLRVSQKKQLSFLFPAERDWVAKGNTLVWLGVYQPVTAAPFSSEQTSRVGIVKVETRRRNPETKERLLGDRFGAVVWTEKIGQGRVILATTPHLAANAYQDFRGNYEYLALLVSQPKLEGVELIQNPLPPYPPIPPNLRKGGKREEAKSQNPLWVDEYIHGYKDAEVIKREVGDNIFSYLAQTPLVPLLAQGLLILLVAIWAGNRRLGKPISLSTPITDNSQAYIQALASVLQKAEKSDFLLSVIGAEEQRQLQKALGLGEVPCDRQSLIEAWVQQTGRTAAELERLLALPSRPSRLSETALLNWLNQWQQLRSNQ